jgi:hypothetical protein
MLFFLITLFFYLSVLILTDDKYHEIIFIVLGVILFLIAGLRAEGVTRDYENYLYAYNNIDISSRFEPTFTIIAFFVKYIFNKPIFLFIIYAVIGVSIKFIAIKQLTNLILLSALLYLSNFFLLHEMTQIRVGVASGILLLCIKPLYERNFKRFFFLVVIAVSFHYTAVVILPLWFLKPISLKKKFYLCVIPFVYLLTLNGLTVGFLIEHVPIPQVQSLYSMYQLQIESGEGDVINLFNSLQILRCAVLFLLIYFSELLVLKNKYSFLLIKIYTIALACFVLFSDIPVISFRISELLSIVEIVLIPLSIYIFKEKRMASLLPISIGFIMLIINLFYVKLIL